MRLREQRALGTKAPQEEEAGGPLYRIAVDLVELGWVGACLQHCPPSTGRGNLMTPAVEVQLSAKPKHPS